MLSSSDKLRIVFHGFSTVLSYSQIDRHTTCQIIFFNCSAKSVQVCFHCHGKEKVLQDVIVENRIATKDCIVDKNIAKRNWNKMGNIILVPWQPESSIIKGWFLVVFIMQSTSCKLSAQEVKQSSISNISSIISLLVNTNWYIWKKKI